MFPSTVYECYQMILIAAIVCLFWYKGAKLSVRQMSYKSICNHFDLGISINVSALVDNVRDICGEVDITPHAVEYTLGFHGDTTRLPDRETLSLSTMCGHGMVSANFAKKMLTHVKEGRIDPEDATRTMAKFCVCGVFNTTRAMGILNKVRKGQ